MEELAELAEWPAWCNEVARDRCLFVSDLSVKRSAVHAEGETEELDQTWRCRCVSDSLQA